MNRAMKTMDGNQAAAHVAYAYSDTAAIYPITPSSTMAELMDEWSVAERTNIFGQTVKVTEMQSEAGAAGAVHGLLSAGALTSTFTASQGLLLMIPNLYKIAGEHLPGVFHVAARALATHALSIFGDHSDVYACRQTGAAMLASSGVQEVMDLAPVAHLAAIAGKTPFIHFFDGFRTSHELQKIEVWSLEDLKGFADWEAISAFRKNALNPEHGKEMGSAQNPDVFFQFREAANNHYDALPELVQGYMDKINEKAGTDYKLFNYHGDREAEHVIIAMGSVCSTIEETVDYLNANGYKTGLIKVRLYRPFSAKHLLAAIPENVKQITVLDRTKEPGAPGEPLYLDVCSALRDSRFHDIPVYAGRYGLGSKDTTPGQIQSVYDNKEKKVFTIGIVDDVTNLSLPVIKEPHTPPEGTICCKFWGLGGDGTVGANKNSIKIIGDHTNKTVQAYFAYDSKKSMGLTVSHLRFGSKPIQSTYLINRSDFTACHNTAYMHKYNIVQEVKDGGTFLLNCPYEGKELDEWLPGQVKRYIAEHHIHFYVINGLKIGREIGLNNKINTILQAAFFKLANIIPVEEAIGYMKDAAKKAYQKKGDAIVKMNFDAIERGVLDVHEVTVPEEWLNAPDTSLEAEALPDRAEMMSFVADIQKPLDAQEGDKVPVSTALKYIDGSSPSGSAAHERRDVAADIPAWKPENCIQCNRCSYVCPHAVIRPIALTPEEKKNAPEGMQSLPMTGMPDYEFSIAISKVDCTGCGSCVAVCPGRMGEKALEMRPAQEEEARQAEFDYSKKLPVKQDVIDKYKETTVKGSQFKKPMLEFSGACAGCGETPYAKLVTQLFGERMYIANATGCSSIWGNSYPATPYTVNEKGQGPAWSNSLFEDAAEYGYGMLLAQTAIRDRLREMIKAAAEEGDADLKACADEWLSSFADGSLNAQASAKLEKALAENGSPACQDILKERDFLSKKSVWVYGGDGWAYDIGFGGLDHVIASGKDINILVFDTEVYSNTGGQASKATPTGSSAKFAAGGKPTAKKDLASIAMSYGNVYVAQIAMGADYNQTIKAITEAESYNGPSLIIAYAPCISHGIKSGMGSSQLEEEKAVAAGYWNLFRYNPALKGSGKNPFMLDSKAPTGEYKDFLKGEVRYASLMQSNPEEAEKLFAKAAEISREQYNYLKKLVTLYGEEN